MLDFKPVHARQLSIYELVERDHITTNDLPGLTNEMIDHMLHSIADCTDADVTFVHSSRPRAAQVMAS